MARCAELIGGKWTLLIIRDLVGGPRYFCDLEKSLGGISPRTLCERLKLLAASGVVSRTRIKALPPRTVYRLTERGHALSPLIDAMKDIGAAWLASPPEATTDEVVCGPCGEADLPSA